MKKFLIFFSIPVCFFYSVCNTSCKRKHGEPGNGATTAGSEVRDTSFLYFEPARIRSLLILLSPDEKFIQDLLSFYHARNNEYAWVNSYGINEYGRNFINLMNHEERTSQDDCILFADRLQTAYDTLSREGRTVAGQDSAAAEFELLMTINFFDYARRNWLGISDEEIRGVGWYIERKKLDYNDLLDTLLKGDPNMISSYEPVYRQYALLKKYLQKYYEIEKEGGWDAWPPAVGGFRIGDTSSFISSVKKQLFQLGDIPINDRIDLFDLELETAVKRFQKRHGLREDGIISGKTLREMTIPVHARIQQLLINMERCRWVPEQRIGDYLLVNIPAFKLFVYRNDTLEWSSNVIVGKPTAANNTVIFNDNLEYIVFSPYWNIPENILRKETLPAILKNPLYLQKHDMEVVTGAGRRISTSAIDWSRHATRFPYIIRQRPGVNNALGLVKFLFPNSYDIYMHDTPEKSLFGEATRTFSHGCIRLEEPYKLARYLLRDDTSYTADKINSLLYRGKETFVKLKEKVPVFIAYFTAWVDEDGMLHFREDVYHHDEKMKQLLFSDETQEDS